MVDAALVAEGAAGMKAGVVAEGAAGVVVACFTTLVADERSVF